MFYWIGGLVWILIAVAVVVVFMQRRNRPRCPKCGLSVDRDLDTCPYCGAHM